MTAKTVCIVSCTAHKRQAVMPAENLYSSDLFIKSRRYAQANYDSWLILSAKHGLVRPSEVLSPYDCKLSSISRDERKVLASRVAEQAVTLLNGSDSSVSSICGEEYDDLLTDAGVRFEGKPEFALPIGKKLQALGTVTDPEKSEGLLDRTYKIIWRLAKKSGLKRLKDVVSSEMPESGVYLFFDEQERRLRDSSQQRVVRVGTHGVAMGSKASLRNRIRTHFGTLSGDGNHRSSIFRLHTGRSLINANRVPAINSWGVPNVAKSALVAERELEQAVSAYLGQLCVLLIAVPGDAEKHNDRAYLEQNLIALLSNGCKPLDPPSSQWLGLSSAKVEIRKSGLWNVNHVSQQFDTEFLDVLEHYVSHTVEGNVPPAKRLAPSGWLARTKENSRQLAFL